MPHPYPLPALLAGEPRPLITDPSLSLLGAAERESLLHYFDQAAARGGREADEVEQFEARFAQKLGVEHVVATVSATAGMQLALEAHGVGPGDEVLTSPYTFAASGHAIVHTGARPVFTDVEMQTLCMDPREMERRITPRTRAVVVVQIGGKPAQMDEINAVARANGLVVVEDAAQAHGATYDGRYVGTLGHAGVYSFSPKLMTSFRGGAIATDDGEVAELCRRLRFHGLAGNRNRVRKQQQMEVVAQAHFVHHEPGYSLCMTPLQAAVLLPQIDALDDKFALRHGNGQYLVDGLARIPGLTPVTGTERGRSNYYMVEVLYDPAGFAGLTRDQLVAALSWEGVPVSPTAATQMLQYRNPSLEAYVDEPCPVAEQLMEDLLVFGHPLQSLVLHGDRERLDQVLAGIETVQRHAEEIAAFYESQVAVAV